MLYMIFSAIFPGEFRAIARSDNSLGCPGPLEEPRPPSAHFPQVPGDALGDAIGAISGYFMTVKCFDIGIVWFKTLDIGNKPLE